MMNKKNINNIIINIFFATAFLQNFIIFSDRVFPMNDLVQLSFLMITISLIVFKVVQEKKVLYTLNRYKLLMLVMGAYSILKILFTGAINIHVLFVFLLIYTLDTLEIENIEIKGIKIYVLIGAISLIFQALIFRFEDGRIVNSFIDPNYSGFIYFMYFLFLWKSDYKKTSLIMIFLGMLTSSRNFVIAVIIYGLFNIKKVQQIGIKFKNVGILLVISHLFLLFSGRIFIQIYEYKLKIGTLTGVNTASIFEIFDASNYHRFLANEKFMELLNYPTEFLFGTNVEWYQQNIFINTPHNYIGSTIVNYGFIYLVISLVFMYKYMKINEDNIALYFSLLAYYLFLGFGLTGYQLIFTVLLIQLFKNSHDKVASDKIYDYTKNLIDKILNKNKKELL